MESKVLSLLNLDKDTYEMRVFCTYMDWCTKHVRSDIEMQRFLTSAALFNWWYSEYQKLEHRFLLLAEHYKSYCSLQDLERIYINETIHIFKLFCKPLIYTARYKHHNVINPSHN